MKWYTMFEENRLALKNTTIWLTGLGFTAVPINAIFLFQISNEFKITIFWMSYMTWCCDHDKQLSIGSKRIIKASTNVLKNWLHILVEVLKKRRFSIIKLSLVGIGNQQQQQFPFKWNLSSLSWTCYDDLSLKNWCSYQNVSKIQFFIHLIPQNPKIYFVFADI